MTFAYFYSFEFSIISLKNWSALAWDCFFLRGGRDPHKKKKKKALPVFALKMCILACSLHQTIWFDFEDKRKKKKLKLFGKVNENKQINKCVKFRLKRRHCWYYKTKSDWWPDDQWEEFFINYLNKLVLSVFKKPLEEFWGSESTHNSFF